MNTALVNDVGTAHSKIDEVPKILYVYAINKRMHLDHNNRYRFKFYYKNGIIVVWIKDLNFLLCLINN